MLKEFIELYSMNKGRHEAYNNFKKCYEPKYKLLNPEKRNSNKINFDFLTNSEHNKEVKNVDYIINQIILFYNQYKIDLKYNKNITGFSSILLYFNIVSKSKIKQIKNLVNDLQLFIKISNIEIIENIEEGAIIFQLPKRQKNIVSLKDIATPSNKGLSIGLGFTPENEKIVVDITKTPHLLVAGATGSGKSVFLNSLICQLISKYNPQELNLLLIDPKKIEFSIYENIPHLYSNIIENVSDCVQILDYIIKIMNERYTTFKQYNSRNITEYNEQTSEKMPYIVIVIDELADFILLNKKSLENKIANIAQKARAAGIHLILATQRPSTDVITGVIKANIPSRIAFTVANRFDSSTILGSKGAENLTGAGDCLYNEVGKNKLIRCQTPYLSEKDVNDIINEVICWYLLTNNFFYGIIIKRGLKLWKN